MKYECLRKGGITSAKGFKVGVAQSGIDKAACLDLALLVSDVPAVGAAVFTTNKFQAAPVQVSRSHLAQGKLFKGVVVNSGCANACTGEAGLMAARKMTEWAAQVTGAQAKEFLVASTGMIGTHLPLPEVEQGIKEAGEGLSKEEGSRAAQAIMTTDTVPKEIAVQIEIDGQVVTLGGMAKGAGMIHPQMATMLGFITTDVAITPECLQKALVLANEASFNLVTVDGDTSTNDLVIVLANGMAGNTIIEKTNSPAFQKFSAVLKKVCIFLAKMIAQDGEGATKLIEVVVHNALNLKEARLAARTVAGSHLLKAAVHGGELIWGRILCALGYAGVEFQAEQVLVYLAKILVVEKGCGVTYDPVEVQKILAKDKVVFTIDLQAGAAQATAWGCDLSAEYVQINAHYKT